MRPTNIIDRFGLSHQRRNLADKILAKYNIPDQGIVIVLEGEDYTGDLITVWGHSAALHLSIQDGGVEEMSPEHLLDLMESKDYNQLIWLSKQACESQDIEFVWILSHELRHLEQELTSNALSKATYFLSRTLGLIKTEEPKVLNTIPAELDANLKAWNIAREMFGNKIVDDYVESESISGKLKKSFEILKTYNPEATYDVIGRTVAFIKKYKNQLKDIQKDSRSEIIRDFDIDSSSRQLESGPKYI